MSSVTDSLYDERMTRRGGRPNDDVRRCADERRKQRSMERNGWQQQNRQIEQTVLQKIKSRFFFSFVIVNLIPFFLCSGCAISTLPNMMKTDFSSMTTIIFLQWIELERNRSLIEVLKETTGDGTDDPERRFEA
jgi:hypothetical protein